MPKPDRFQFLGRADDISIVGDEAGFELHFSTPRGDYTVNVHGVASDLYWSARQEIGSWLSEAEAARVERRDAYDFPNPKHYDADAYDLNDPKHPGWSVGV